MPRSIAGAAAGALEAAPRAASSNLVFHSLSKRSAAPGLRSGFLAGDAALIRRNQQLVNYGGVAVPYPILAASTALWRDEAHVEAGRERYRAQFRPRRGQARQPLRLRRRRAGFFLWLEVGDGEAAARQLWAEAGLRVLPGGYMARPDAEGRNPGEPYIRVALVQEPAATEDGLDRLVAALAPRTSAARDDMAAAAMSDPTNTGLPAGRARVFLQRRLIEAVGIWLCVLAVAFWWRS